MLRYIGNVKNRLERSRCSHACFGSNLCRWSDFLRVRATPKRRCHPVGVGSCVLLPKLAYDKGPEKRLSGSPGLARTHIRHQPPVDNCNPPHRPPHTVPLSLLMSSPNPFGSPVSGSLHTPPLQVGGTTPLYGTIPPLSRVLYHRGRARLYLNPYSWQHAFMTGHFGTPTVPLTPELSTPGQLASETPALR